MTKWRPAPFAIGLLLLGMLYVRACWEPSIRADERKRAGDRRDDSTIARLAAEQIATEQRFTRERDSTEQVIAKLRSRIAPRGSIYPRPEHGDSAGIYTQLAARDSLIAALTAGRAQDSLQLVFWRSAVAQRDSIIPRLQAARDSWRREASKPRHTLTDIAGGVALGYGLARENEVAAGVGGALILVPRVVDALGRLF